MGHKRQLRKKILSRLEQSMAQQQPVSIARSVKTGAERRGVVQEIGDEWILMAAIRDGGYLNGYKPKSAPAFQIVDGAKL